MDGQSRLTINLLMWLPHGLNFCHVGYVMWDSHIKKQFPLGLGRWLCWGEGVGLFGSDEERGEGIVLLLYVGLT